MASAVPVITNPPVVIADTYAAGVPEAAVLFAGPMTHDAGAGDSVVEKDIVQDVVVADPIETVPNWLAPEATPFVPVPQAPLAIVGVP